MEECCDICGDIGVAEALMTCSQCKRNTEHIEREAEVLWRVLSGDKWYCMRICLEVCVDDWHCEECSEPPSSCLLEELTDAPKINSSEVHKGGELCAENRKLPNKSRAGAGDWEKKVPTGKTRYICVTDAIKLSSGEKKSFPSPSPKERRKSGMGKFDAAVRRRTSLPIFSSHQNLASGPLRSRKPQRPGNMEIHKKHMQQSKKLTAKFRSLNSLQPSQVLEDTNRVKKQPSEVQLPVKRKLVKQSSVPSANTSPIAISGGDGHNNAAENMSKIRLLDSEKFLSIPALDALWKGSFRIQDDHVHKEISHLVQAHPPSRVLKTIYEFSKQMPEVLHFELVPSRQFWNSLFNEDIPDKRDIALYFFPGVGERSVEDYIFLVDHMISMNYALREQIADFELLVFSSKLLPDDCQCWEGKYFLWGIFHRVKRYATTCSDNMGLESTVQPSDDLNHNQSQVHDREEVDMDIDLIGGINVGRIDIPVPKEPPRMKYTEEERTSAMALPESALQVASGLIPTVKIPAPNVKIESHDLIPPRMKYTEEGPTAMALLESAPQVASCLTPAAKIPPPSVKIEPIVPPGFEEVYRLRTQSLFSSVDVVGGRDVNKGR